MKKRAKTLPLLLVGTLLLGTIALLGAQKLIAGSESSKIPMSPNRRALSDPEKARIRAELGTEVGNIWIQQHGLGVASKLSTADLEYYRNRGTSESFLLNWIAEYGISSEEAEALRSIGVDLAVSVPAAGAGPYHSAAFADIVVIGEIAAIADNPAGPYHGSYQVDVAEYLKNCSSSSPPVFTGRLLETGAHQHRGHIHSVEFSAEPNLDKGERVVLFLSRTPFSLIGKLQIPRSPTEMQDLVENYGPIDTLLNELALPSGFEVIDAYKIVGEHAVWKMRALHVESWHEVVDLAVLRDQIQKIGVAQSEFCTARNRS